MSELAEEQGGQSRPAPDVLAMDGWGSAGPAAAAYAPNGANGHAPEAAPLPEPIPELAPAGERAEADSAAGSAAGEAVRAMGRAELVRAVRKVAPVAVAAVLTAGALLSWRGKLAGGERLTAFSQLPRIPTGLAGQKRAGDGAGNRPGDGAGLDQGSFDELRRRLAELIAPEPPAPPPPLHRRWLDRLGGQDRG